MSALKTQLRSEISFDCVAIIHPAPFFRASQQSQPLACWSRPSRREFSPAFGRAANDDHTPVEI